MSLMSTAASMKPSLSDPWEQLDRIERRIGEEFSRRVHNFRIRAFDDGLVLEGHTKTYYGKQLVTHAVMEATDLPILANRIVVGGATSDAIRVGSCDPNIKASSH